jgi:O-methyltransferase
MSTAVARDPYAQNGFIKLSAKKVLHLLHSVLPQPIYSALYTPFFAAYQELIRLKYRFRLNVKRLVGEQKTVVRMEHVLAVMKHSLVGTHGLEHTYDLAVTTLNEGVPGAFVECGVARGGCAALLGTVAQSATTPRTCWFFDSYQGLPDPTSLDYENGRTGRHVRPLPKGSCLGTYDSVAKLLFKTFGLNPTRNHMIKGWFQDSLPIYADKIGPIAVLRIDGDWYESTRVCLETLFPNVTDGGFVIIDDYFSCFGAKRATDEYLLANLPQAELVPDGRGGASFQVSRIS